VLDRDKDIGSLAVGKAADFVILDRRLTSETTADVVRELKPAQTFFAGKEVTSPGPCDLGPARHILN
jgi:predicted amidohydrolase YtcJ